MALFRCQGASISARRWSGVQARADNVYYVNLQLRLLKSPVSRIDACQRYGHDQRQGSQVLVPEPTDKWIILLEYTKGRTMSTQIMKDIICSV